MLLIPAIDLKDGQCVRLRQGDLNDTTIFSDNPSTVAEAWLKKGAERLHLVDLNGAFAGRPKNQAAIEDILATIDREIPVQIGGGIRDMATIEHYLDSGIDYVIIGTAAVKDPGFLQDACSAFSGHIIVGLDAKDGKVATDGWAKVTKNDVIEMAKRFEDFGVESIIYTDIGRDGMLTGVNVEATVRLAQATRIPVIASGGVTDISDIEALCNVSDEGIEGVILGRSIYEGTLDFEEALDYVDDYFEEAEE
ncbi:MAG: 1-(5-phosphoribosyl)-5-[(5-phosphoribosylamino)methylideneamino]imidazole-4-carboxamide isomerase [Alcaligenaceae bacterium]|jgi:phosphoribosylformimino-5-aminoimidazole carboxamide ribotide isomerase|nr:1-(5-phosphoribosyl)-5-[(5-phosphoribosylamino)methylideneamino]imidazole-4-carboxamide isomerase [Alcaligenaceae bacterium]